MIVFVVEVEVPTKWYKYQDQTVLSFYKTKNPKSDSILLTESASPKRRTSSKYVNQEAMPYGTISNKCSRFWVSQGDAGGF